MGTILLIMILLSFVGLIYAYIRNNRVHAFCISICDKCIQWDVNNPDKISSYYWCLKNVPSYNKMFFSFKPLKMEYWLPKDQIIKLNTYLN